MFSSRLRRALLAALGVHALLAGLVLRSRNHVETVAVNAPAAEREPVEIDLKSVPDEIPSPPAPVDAPAEGAKAAPMHVAMVERHAVEPRAETAEPSEREEAAPTADGPPAAPIAITRGPSAVGALGTNPFLPTSEAAVEAAERKRVLDRAMKDPARERDHELGLGPEGPVMKALAEGTSASTAPVKGRAVFVAETDVSGCVVAIELLESEGSRAGWDDARQQALAALRGKKLRLPSSTTRAVMRIEVTSGWKLPSGQDPGAEISVLKIPVSHGEGKDSPKVAFLEPKLEMQDIMIAPGTTIRVPTFQLQIFSTNADPTNLGAKPRRIIHAHPLDTKLM